LRAHFALCILVFSQPKIGLVKVLRTLSYSVALKLRRPKNKEMLQSLCLGPTYLYTRMGSGAPAPLEGHPPLPSWVLLGGAFLSIVPRSKPLPLVLRSSSPAMLCGSGCMRWELCAVRRQGIESDNPLYANCVDIIEDLELAIV
jgi:hypothetical protein